MSCTKFPDPSTLPATVRIQSLGLYDGRFNCGQCETYNGGTWDGVMTLETGYTLYSFQSLDRLYKKGFGHRSAIPQQQVITPGVYPAPTPQPSGPYAMWLLQCVIAYMDTLSVSGSGGWVMRFYCGSENRDQVAGLAVGSGLMAWEGELVGADPRGRYARTPASCAAGPPSMVTS